MKIAPELINIELLINKMVFGQQSMKHILNHIFEMKCYADFHWLNEIIKLYQKM